MLSDFYYRIIEYFTVYDWPRFLFWARTISALVSLGLIAAMVVIVRKISPYSKPRFAKTGDKAVAPNAMKEPWQQVLKKLGSENPADWNLAVIQADSIVDSILKEMGLVGETMGERMRTLDKGRLSSLDDLWEAHRVRNDIAHSPDRTVSKHRAAQAIGLFEKVLKEMGYLT
ncbi:MAG: hypothetical protein HYW90_02725 [Candidatus Sungbacteria bacterium]|nr:hypothetical protein [Candidatus Sungbacteria bacterium]